MYIKSWSSKRNECPKCKETIKGYSKQPDMDSLLEFYQQLCDKEKLKLQKVKELLEEREEMQTRINSILDQNNQTPKRPSTAAPQRNPGMKTTPNVQPRPSTPENKVKSSSEVEDNGIMCKICK